MERTTLYTPRDQPFSDWIFVPAMSIAVAHFSCLRQQGYLTRSAPNSFPTCSNFLVSRSGKPWRKRVWGCSIPGRRVWRGWNCIAVWTGRRNWGGNVRVHVLLYPYCRRGYCSVGTLLDADGDHCRIPACGGPICRVPACRCRRLQRRGRLIPRWCGGLATANVGGVGQVLRWGAGVGVGGSVIRIRHLSAPRVTPSSVEKHSVDEIFDVDTLIAFVGLMDHGPVRMSVVR